jgi:hypothetical protein
VAEGGWVLGSVVSKICLLRVVDVDLPIGITAFLRSHDPRFDPRPWCHALPKSEYEDALAVSSHPLYAPRPLVSAS